MAATQRIVFQPYTRRKQARGASKLEACTPIFCRDVEEGLRRVEKVAAGGTLFVGAHLVRSMVDEDAGDYGEPEILAAVGDLPEVEG
ncbi:conserved hypothetical protein [Gluconacetobacter diazotrophicus PA1 5]|uniref:hypothetical protein n=1 Tax=Gluconacetobacter diazotrophicus TaxID=33996 RepID=UPI000173DB78|nr:hypothetical protein [Gluconacetobacter diazotrophicus]ACI52227.1 conserved hypothetical protein [Gluconacetobacter diazotrophicus PA1 5]